MLLYKEQNAISDVNALRTAALDLTYYNMADHPAEKSVDWASPNLCNITEALTPASGIIKTSIDEMITIIESKTSETVASHKAYCQYFVAQSTLENNIAYYASSTEEPKIHYEWDTGFKPIYNPDHVVLLYIAPSSENSTLEFWNHNGQENFPNTLEQEEVFTTNDLVIFNPFSAYRFTPPLWGITQNDSGLHLLLYVKYS